MTTIDTKAVLKTFADELKRLRSITKDCRDDMHEPDEQEVTAKVFGDHLDNAFGVPTGIIPKHSEYVVAIWRGSRLEYFNLADLIALARIAGEVK